MCLCRAPFRYYNLPPRIQKQGGVIGSGDRYRKVKGLKFKRTLYLDLIYPKPQKPNCPFSRNIKCHDFFVFSFCQAFVLTVTSYVRNANSLEWPKLRVANNLHDLDDDEVNCALKRMQACFLSRTPPYME